jgi:hypothetical protein
MKSGEGILRKSTNLELAAHYTIQNEEANYLNDYAVGR